MKGDSKCTIILNSPFLDRLYMNASTAYMAAEGPPNPKIKSTWIGNRVSDELGCYNEKVLSIQKDINSDPRINEIRLLSH